MYKIDLRHDITSIRWEGPEGPASLRKACEYNRECLNQHAEILREVSEWGWDICLKVLTETYTHEDIRRGMEISTLLRRLLKEVKQAGLVNRFGHHEWFWHNEILRSLDDLIERNS